MNKAIETIKGFYGAKEALQDYLDGWNQEIFNVLIGGTIEYARELESRLEKEKEIIIVNLQKECPDQSDLIEENRSSTELQEAAIKSIENCCVYSELLRKFFGQAGGTVPGKCYRKGSIYNPHPIEIAPVRGNRRKRKK